MNGLWTNVLAAVLSALLVTSGGPCTNVNCCSEVAHQDRPLDGTHAYCCDLTCGSGSISAFDQADSHRSHCCCNVPHLPLALQSYLHYGDDLDILGYGTVAGDPVPEHTRSAISRVPLVALAAQGPSLRSIRSTVLII